jgi:hypothetical protein
MKQYFSRITDDYWTPKNQLEKAAKELARKMDRRLINEMELTDFRLEFEMQIKLLNQKFNRCKPLELTDSYDHHTIPNKKEDDITISVPGVFYMCLFITSHQIPTDYDLENAANDYYLETHYSLIVRDVVVQTYKAAARHTLDGHIYISPKA